MRRLLLGLIVSGMAASAHAVPIPFEFSGSSLDATGALAFSSYSSNDGSAVLDNGESANFTFGTVRLFGGGLGQLTLTVSFIDPTAQDVDAVGPYSVVATGIYNEGHWTGGSTQFAYSFGGYSGNALLTLDPIDEECYSCKPTFDFTGSITNLGSVAVPAPATLSLLGIGLLGLGLARRRRA